MPALPAARVGDQHVCPMFNPGTPPPPHVGGPVLPPGDVTVWIGKKPAACATDKATCAGPPDVIVTGSMTVLIGKKPAARQTDSTMHGGTITVGAPTVRIGGGTTGATLGNPDAAAEACREAANGRTSGATGQSYGNCGVESSRQVINKSTNQNICEDDLLHDALNDGNAVVDSAGVFANNPATWDHMTGGTSALDRQNVLAKHGVSSSVQLQTMPAIRQAVAEGRGVITAHDAGILWNDPQYNGGGHAILTTGLEYDEHGQLQNVIVNDTGTGQCGQSIPAPQYLSSLIPGTGVNITDQPVWR